MPRATVGFRIQANEERLPPRTEAVLQDAGFNRVGTSSYETSDRTLQEICVALNMLLTNLTRLDHLSIYVGDADTSAPDHPK